ncbi:hypothetical protein AMTRI_Chr01g110440 [Amborella trichopoda]
MLVVSWNAQGLGGARRRRQLRRLTLKCRPNVLVLQETKLESLEMSFLRKFWGSGPTDYAFSPSNGRFVISGYILKLSFRFIVIYFCGSDGFLWYLTNAYGSNAPGEKEEFLNSLSAIVSRVGIPWCGAGDFNMVRGGHKVLSQALDYFLVVIDWAEKFPKALVKAFLQYASNHTPILLDPFGVAFEPHPIRFELMWLEDKALVEVPGFVISSKLKLLKNNLKVWGRTKFRNLAGNIGRLEQEISNLNTVEQLIGGLNQDRLSDINAKKMELDNFLFV